MSFIPSFSEGTHLGEGTIVTGTFGITGSEYHGKPLPLTELTMRLPKGAVLSNAGFPTCPRATLEPSGPGPSACPKGSAAGPTGSFTMFVAFGAEYHEEQGVVETYFSPEGGVWLLLAGHTPVFIELLAAGHYLAAAPPLGPAVHFEVPLIETVPGAPLASTSALTIPLGVTKESEGKVSASVTAPVECTSTAGWKADAKFSDNNGHEASESKEPTTACPTAGKRIGTTISVLASRSRLVEGEADRYTATVTPTAPSETAPSGTVTFREGPFTVFGCEHVPISPASSSGKAVCEANPQEGTDQIAAVYNGDSNFVPSESLPIEVAVIERHQAEEEAAALKRAEEATAKKRAEEEAAAGARKKAEEEAAARLKQQAEEGAARLSAQIQSALLSALTPSAKGGRLAVVRKHGSYVVSFAAPSAGEVVISWYELPKGAHLSSARPVLVASGRASTSAAGGVKLTIKLTAIGKRLLKARRSLKLTAKGTFTPAGHPATSTTKQFTLH
jgi:hypothetical protein